MTDSQLRLSELLAALSLAADLGTGMPMETTLRVSLLATRLAQAAGADPQDVSATFYTGLLWSAGCTSTAHEERIRFGDDIGLKRAMAGTDFERPTEVMRRATQIGADWGAGARVQGFTGLLRHGRAHGADIAAFHCEAAARLASRLGLGDAVLDGLGAFFEYWNGSGGPQARRGEAIPFAARAARLAYEAVHALRIGADAVVVIRSRAGRELDPELAAVFELHVTDLVAALEQESVWPEVLAAEPEPRPWAPASKLDDFARAFGDFVDLKSVYWLGHSIGVAKLAEAAAARMNLSEAERVALRRAASLHSLGRVAVSNRIWEKPAPLSAAEWERVRLYPYFTDRVVSRAPGFADAVRTASGAQERLDGNGYHRGLPAAAQPAPVRLLAVAAAYQSMTETRPYRPPLEPSQAAAALREAAAGGQLDGEAVRAVLEAAGHRRRRGTWPAGLTDREIEVLRLVARGRPNRQVAETLHISEETARNHVKHIYEKIGVSTRAGAALFAMEQGLFLPEK
ncbi:MAG TPA: HD domain-containing phosphohydrolase [Candidatus Dormibacteraeota bacterium]